MTKTAPARGFVVANAAKPSDLCKGCSSAQGAPADKTHAQPLRQSPAAGVERRSWLEGPAGNSSRCPQADLAPWAIASGVTAGTRGGLPPLHRGVMLAGFGGGWSALATRVAKGLHKACASASPCQSTCKC